VSARRTKRVAIWAAVSSLPQAKKISLEDQLAVGRQHAERHHAEVVAELVVPGESRNIVLFEEAASRINAYNDLRTLIDTKSIDVLIYLDRSRLGRTAALSMAVAELCNRAGILLYETESPPADLEFRPADHSDMLIGAIKSVDAQHEIRKIQERHRKGMADRVARGRMPGKINFGYVPVYEHGKLSGYSIDEEAAETVRLIVSLYLDRGFGALNIADHLNRVGKPAPAGGQWGHSQVTFLLRRIWRYAGFAELNVHSKSGRPYVRAKGLWPAIITEDQARAVVAEREARNDARKSVHTVYRFTRMVYCAVCGARFHALTKRRTWTKADGSPGEFSHVAYRCPADHTSIGEKKILRAVEELLKLLDDETFRAGYVAPPAADRTAAIMAEIETLQAQAAKLTDGIARADNDYYMRQALDADRHQAIVSNAKKQLLAIAADITTLQDSLHAAEIDNQRSDRVDDARINTLPRLYDLDVRASNAWLRRRFRIIVEARQVVEIEIL
jgi:DNA invertase Pin-like site-specific DNA recombinase